MEAPASILRGSVYVPGPPDTLGAEASEAADASARITVPTPALSRIERGKLDKQIAFELGIGDSKLKARVGEIVRKLGVRNRNQVALRASAPDFDRAGM